MAQFGATDSVFEKDVRPYIQFEGEVEIRWSDGTTQDLKDYMDHDSEFKEYKGEFDPDMCKKDMKRGVQTILWCIACSCEQKQMGTLLNHIKGKKHTNKVMEFRRQLQGVEKAPPQVPKAKKAKTALPGEKDARYSLTELLQRYPTDPALGLNYIHEWNDPRGRGVKWYTCTLQGCKSAWGKSFEMCAHLIGNKNKHSRNYLGSRGVSDTNMLTLDKLLDCAREQDKKERGNLMGEIERDRDYDSIVRHYDDERMYRELSNRPKDWSHSKEEQKRLARAREQENFKSLMDVIKRGNSFVQVCEQGLEDPSDGVLHYILNCSKSSLASVKLAREQADNLQDVSQQESIKSSCTKLKTRLQKLESEANFRVGVAQAVQSSLRPFYINASHPVKVKIGSKEKFDRQVAYLAGKVLRTELKRAEHHNFNVDDQMRKSIRVLVDQTMKNFPSLIDL